MTLVSWLRVDWIARRGRWQACAPTGPLHQHAFLPFSHVHIDLVGPQLSINGFTHVFTIMDHSTCWPATYPIQNTSADTCIAALSKWISGFGVPATLTSDRGSLFTLSSWSAFCRSLDIEHIMTTAYPPQSNGWSSGCIGTWRQH